jgi:putative PIN family toxin of toxin-antitoxin system
LEGATRPAEQGVVTPAAVFDCMVFVQTLGNAKGPACACYELVCSGRLVLHVSLEILVEVADVLSRPKVRRKLPALTDEAVEAFLRDVHSRARMHSEVPEGYRLERDPKDERYLNLAIASEASYLVSWDRDLLDLMNDDEFRQQFPGLTILEPPALLRLFSQAPPETKPA